jgi:hypothetical protein
MTQSSFYADGEIYDTAVVESNDVSAAPVNSGAPSSFYANGGVVGAGTVVSNDTAPNPSTSQAPSSFFANGGLVDAQTVESNDTPGNNVPSQAPSGFYRQGGVYDYLSEESVIMSTLSGLAAQVEADAAATAAALTTVQSTASTVTSAVSNEAALRLAADNAEASTRAAADTALSTAKADKTYVDTQDAAIAATVTPKADKTYVDTQDGTLAASLLTKASTTYVDAQDALKAPLASPALTGTPTAPTATVGDNSTKIATTAFVIANAGSGGGGGGGVGQCKLVWTSNTVITLVPYGGQTIKINGANVSVPAAGVTLSNTGLVASTRYYVYAWMNAGTMTLEASTTGFVKDTAAGNVGIHCKSGDSSRSLVGMIFVFSDGKFYDNSSNRMVRSWFNEPVIQAMGTSGTATSTTSTTSVETDINTRCALLTWAGEDVLLQVNCTGFNNTAGQYAYLIGAMDGTGFTVSQYTGSNGAQYTPMFGQAVISGTSDLLHTFQQFMFVSGATGFYGNKTITVTTGRRVN